MRRKQEDKDEVEHRSVCKHGGGDGVAWFRGAMIGKGGFGSVYLANLKKPKLKYGCFPAIMAVKSAEVSVSGSIQKEREVLSNLGQCPYIIRCFGDEITMGLNGEMVFNLLLEYGSGGTLADLIKKSGGSGLLESDVRCYTRSILRGLNHIHDCGYVHCDLKPENILIVSKTTGTTTKLRVKIGDFGLAKRATRNKKRKLDPYLRGTPMYLSPEAVVDNIQEPPSDIWALGCIVLEMLTGKPPWDGKQDLGAEVFLQQIGESHELPKVPSTISKEGKEFLKGCFARKSMYRLTAEMLLNHSFVEGLADDDDDDDDDDDGEVEDEAGLSLMLYETDNESIYSDSSFSDDCSFVSDDEFFLSSWSEEEDEINSEEFSSFAKERKLEDALAFDHKRCRQMWITFSVSQFVGLKLDLWRIEFGNGSSMEATWLGDSLTR
ncbi:Mitogen-activated protein kinase kinase kinase 17 [Camellia lanceoleosa]|uniref:Mitogen-activated protein kinase kinase kinase 17 n=1 Tax=Camellia lanceoleosa TaxID=1840588 RepID=A0ACC0I6M6_9ERIC|nr:Mitogen-activated protein kinase kinase kinase 17 [Camellia lanceoleosa]